MSTEQLSTAVDGSCIIVETEEELHGESVAPSICSLPRLVSDEIFGGGEGALQHTCRVRGYRVGSERDFVCSRKKVARQAEFLDNPTGYTRVEHSLSAVRMRKFKSNARRKNVCPLGWSAVFCVETVGIVISHTKLIVGPKDLDAPARAPTAVINWASNAIP